ncbi:MAG: carboxypeptidase regulatory-like domain-containing protein [Candidatus Woesearchaeota archaeon]
MEVKKRGLFGVVLALFLVIILSNFSGAEQGGCYTFPKGSPELYCKAGMLDTAVKEDCGKFPDCKFEQYFTPGSDCSKIEDCQEVTCPVDCQTHPWGYCKQLGKTAGKEPKPIFINSSDYEELYNLWCGNVQGCCKFERSKTQTFCQSGMKRYDCEAKAAQWEITDLQQIIYDNSVGMNLKTCNEKYCKLEILPATLNVEVYDDSNKSIEGAQVSLEAEDKTATTDASGKAQFSLTPKTYIVKVSKEKYSSQSRTVPLSSNSTINLSIILSKPEGAATISGIVKDADGKPLAKATISWGEQANQQVSTDEAGAYITPELSIGEITLTASAIGYSSQAQNITLKKGPNAAHFQLSKTSLPTISGKTYVDKNANNESDADEIVYGARIFVDGEFRGLSSYPDGRYSIILANNKSELHSKYNISATYQDYEMKKITISPEGKDTTTWNILLTKSIGECSQDGPSPQKKVEVFSAQPVLGKKEVLLTWDRPCPEVVFYTLEKYQGTELLKTFIPTSTAKELTDTEVEWGQTYTYKIVATFESVLSSESANEQSITLGDEPCAGRYHNLPLGWETFCFGEDQDTRRLVWTCDNNNKLVVSLNCADRDGVNSQGVPSKYYCAKVGSGSADCKDSGACSLFANPFGLYSTRNSCYGSAATAAEGAENYCYYDKSHSIVDHCQSCMEVKNCFDYNSKDACLTNNCLARSCQWTDGAANTALLDYSLLQLELPFFVTSETGAGYCTEVNYAKDDRCNLCSPLVSLFENYYCTADVCSVLGKCFSANQLKRCQSCGVAPTAEANCYTYVTEQECSGGQSVAQNDLGIITASKDRCGWKKCFWKGEKGGAGTCVKDGNLNKDDDCLFFSDGGQRGACMRDNTPPLTKIFPAGAHFLSNFSSNLTFEADDTHFGTNTNAQQSNPLGKLGFCLTSADPTAPDTCSINSFKETNYPGKLTKESLNVNIINFLGGENIPGKTYRLKYYSTDKYFNREDIKEAAVYIDNVPPSFTIENETITTLDKTNFKVYLTGLNEPMSCSFDLSSLLPLGDTLHQESSLDLPEKEATFIDLPGLIYHLIVNCTDRLGNNHYDSKDYAFDLNQKIDIVYPPQNGKIAQQSISFKVRTLLGSTCALYKSNTNEKVADFKTDQEGKEHLTEEISGFVEKSYTGEYKVVCTELISQETSEESLNFAVSFSAPTTQIILREGSRTEQPTENGWEKYFIRSATASLTCTPLEGGFDCAKTYYCLGLGCDMITSPNYQEYSAEFTLNGTIDICYYSIDQAGNKDFQPLCGKVIVDGFGITLEIPKKYFYQGEVWGISNQPTFNWQFFTRVSSSECGFDFTSGFDYTGLPPHQKKSPSSEGKYLFEGFPESVFTSYPSDGGIKSAFVKCFGEEISPEQKMNLEYDPTAPIIEEAFSDPEVVLEGLTTTLVALTDDKTTCRYSDNSEGDGSSEYLTMPYSFPGEEDNTLNLDHSTSFSINNVDDTGKKDYSLSVQCKNGAEDLSEVKELNFQVDYFAAGFILTSSLRPRGYVNTPAVDLGLSTNKNSQCEYRGGKNADNTSAFVVMEGAGSKFHSSHLEGLTDGYYKYPLKCVMKDYTAEAAIEFTIDTLAPTLTEVNDGNFTCGSDKINVYVYSGEGNLTNYYYEVYDLGADQKTLDEKEASFKGLKTSTANKSILSSNYSQWSASTLNAQLNALTNAANKSSMVVSTTNQKVLVLNASVGSTLPLEISTTNLNLSHQYSVKVRAGDAAGNWGDFKESDSFFKVAANYTPCKADKNPPKITLNLNDSCGLASPLVEIRCEDEMGCKEIKYGTNVNSKDCQTNLTYNGNKISLSSKMWVCYFASDNVGNNATGKELVDLKDSDGDKILDRCDNCSGTGANEIVDINGCSNKDISLRENESLSKTDSDEDGLPDSWEKEHNDYECVFDYLLYDSDANSISDAKDDYDLDSYTNYQEYLYNTDPCDAGDMPSILLGESESLPEEIAGNETDLISFPLPTPTSPSAGRNVLPWILFIIGLLLTLGGSGYLIYYYNYQTPSGKTPPRATAPGYYQARAPTEGATSAEQSWKNKFLQFRKSREEKQKQRSRENIFSEFSTSSKEIPHVDKIISSRAPVEQKLQQVAQKYAEHKEELHPGLKPEEKNLFAKLENLTQKSKGKSLSQAVGKDESQNLFNKLKEMSKKRKEGEK